METNCRPFLPGVLFGEHKCFNKGALCHFLVLCLTTLVVSHDFSTLCRSCVLFVEGGASLQVLYGVFKA